MKYAADVNAYLSNPVVFYLKPHDLHRNIKGMQLVPIREYSESRCRDTAEKFDEIAQLIIRHGEKPVFSISENKNRGPLTV